MATPLSLKGILAGKRMFVSDNSESCTVAELRCFLSRFPVSDTLRLLGDVATQIASTEPNVFGTVGGVAVPLHAIPYLALLSIEESDDLQPPSWGYCSFALHEGTLQYVRMMRAGGMSELELARAVKMFDALPEPINAPTAHSDDKAFEFMLRMSQAQFVYQTGLHHLLPRTVLIYRDLWPKVEKAGAVLPLDDVRAITGLGFDELLLLGASLFGGSRKGFVRAYPSAELAKLGISDGAQQRFLDWASADYAALRTLSRKHQPPDEAYDQYRFNPLHVHPLVAPQVQPDPDRGVVYLLPCPRLLLMRVTQGLYHDLANHHARGRKNDFKTAFGHVFQEYVGVLLREALSRSSVLAEWSYGADVGTPDWIVLEGNRAVVIEVKQSAQFLVSKMWGRLSDLRDDFSKTLGVAFKQLHRFEVDLAQRMRGLEQLRHVTALERVVVTHDQLWWANWIGREQAQQVAGTPDLHVHVMSIDELERLLAFCRGESLFDLLARKRLGDEDQDIMDVHDWLGQHLDPEGKMRNPYLKARYDEIMSEWTAGRLSNAGG